MSGAARTRPAPPSATFATPAGTPSSAPLDGAANQTAQMAATATTANDHADGGGAITLDDVIAQIRALPSLPAVVTELLTSMEEEDIDVHALAGKSRSTRRWPRRRCACPTPPFMACRPA